jgi:predicted transcriptional regulator
LGGIYRDKLDIVASILEVASKNAKKTQIMYQANLSYTILQKYLSKILKAALIKYDETQNCYLLTVKGKNFLETYNEYRKENQHVEQQLQYLANARKTLHRLCQVN